jgi:hypothetical protein
MTDIKNPTLSGLVKTACKRFRNLECQSPPKRQAWSIPEAEKPPGLACIFYGSIDLSHRVTMTLGGMDIYWNIITQLIVICG